MSTVQIESSSFRIQWVATLIADMAGEEDLDTLAGNRHLKRIDQAITPCPNLGAATGAAES